MPELALMDEPMAGSKRDIVPPLHEHGAKGGSHGNPHAAAKLHWHTWLRADVVGARPATFPAHESNRTGLLPLLADRAVTYGSTIYRAFQKRPVQKAPATI